MSWLQRWLSSTSKAGVPAVVAYSPEELRRFLRKLIEPPPGKVRVFRGQTKDYRDQRTGASSLVPSLIRGKASKDYDVGWMHSMIAVLQELPELSEASSNFVDTAEIWAPALIQHYSGPGSFHLDVTSDIGIALWFSLHKRLEKWIRVGVDPTGSLQLEVCTAWYRALQLPRDTPQEDWPVLYVFDVEPWDVEDGLRHGQLVDLRLTPQGRCLKDTATRIGAQAACLLYSDPEEPSGPNLADRLRAVVKLAPEYKIGAAEQRPAKELFPPPAEDPFYRSLLQMPACISLEARWLSHPLEIPLYLVADPPIWESGAFEVVSGKGNRSDPATHRFVQPSASKSPGYLELEEFVKLGRVLTPPLLHSFLVGDGAELSQSDAGWTVGGSTFHFRDATPFLLETPIWRMTPGVRETTGLTAWNQPELAAQVPDMLDGRRTDSVYVELSPLDVMPTPGDFDQMLRGWWMVRAGKTYGVALHHWQARSGPSSVAIGFQFDDAKGAFEWFDPLGRAGPEANAELRVPALKALFLTLTLLRDLTPGRSALFGVNLDLMFGPSSEPTDSLAVAHAIASTPYLVPRARDGSRYKPAGMLFALQMRAEALLKPLEAKERDLGNDESRPKLP